MLAGVPRGHAVSIEETWKTDNRRSVDSGRRQRELRLREQSFVETCECDYGASRRIRGTVWSEHQLDMDVSWTGPP